MQKVFFFTTLVRLCSFANKLGASNVWINGFHVQLYKHLSVAVKLVGPGWPGEVKYFVHLGGIQSETNCNPHKTHSIKIRYHNFVLTFIFLIFFKFIY